MRANREDIPFNEERRPPYMLLVGAASLLLLAILLYIGLSDPDETAPTPMPVVRDSAIVAPPVVDTPPTQQPQATDPGTGTPRDFTERQLAPPTSTRGAGAAPASERAQVDSLVIDGELLEELEEEAQSENSADE